jgi:hypothetical protein
MKVENLPPEISISGGKEKTDQVLIAVYKPLSTWLSEVR